MSVQDPASSFGAPGGAWDSVSCAAAPPGQDTSARASKNRSAIEVAAPLRRSILVRTRALLYLDDRPDENLPAVLPLQRCRRRRTRVFCTRGPSLTIPKTASNDRHRGIVGKIHSINHCRCCGVGLGLGWSVLFRREEDAWETVGGGWSERTWRPCARSS